MKTMTKRSLAWLASLMLLVSIFAGVIVVPAQAATVNYVYSGNYVYNWGQREELATFLSPMAENFYDANGVEYAALASLSGSSTIGSVPDSSLYGELHELMYGNLDNPTSYDATKSMFQYTDCENSGGSISSFYSGKEIGPAWDGGSTWNREHVWPNSKSNGGSNSNTQRETDIMMLRPASVSENSGRSNTAYGEGSSYYHPNEESGGTYDLRGDVSRIVLYVYVCWGGSSAHDGALEYMWGSSGVIESKDILLKWIEEDPVDTWELGRNDSVEAITGTRNVFVDYPELAFLLFNEDVPAGYDSPSGQGSTAGYTVTASTNNSNYGTVSVSGNVITASPKTGYAATGYTILSGTATVTQNGNKFTVSPSSDVSVRINFGKREQVTVQFVQAGSTSTQTAYVGDGITLPAHSGAVTEGQTFLGWCSDEVTETTTEPTYYAAGSQLTAAAGMTLYALYARSEEGGVGNNNTYESYSGALTEGDYLIVFNDGAMIAEINSGTRFNYVDVDTSADTIKDPAANAVWHIAPSGSNWTLYNASAGAYAGGNGTKNKAALLTTLTDYGKWTATGDGTYEFVNVGNKAAGVNANLRRNTTYGYACYSTSTGGALTLYKRASGTLYYFTATAAPCEHAYDNACDASCNLCGAVRTPADHVYTSQVTTAPTCGVEGVRTYTCSVCGDSYTEAIAATGAHTYTNACDTNCNVCGATRTITHSYVGAVTTAPTCGAEGVRTYTCSVCGDSYTEAIAATGEHTYDYACDADCNVCGGIRIPADHQYTADCDTICDVCGAVRTITVGGETTIVFDADKTHRIEFSTATQVWQNGNLTITNNKTSSSSNVADYSDPIRFYKDSEIIIAYPGMTTLVIHITSGYASAWETTLTNAGLSYTADGSAYTIAFATPVDSVTLIPSAQIRAASMTAAGAGAEHEYDNACDAICNACGMEREVGDHVYDNDNDTTCNECGAVRQIAAQVLSGGLTSVSEDVNGLAFFFTADVSGSQTQNGCEYVQNSATVVPFVGGASYKVVKMGAIVSNQDGAILDMEHVDDNYIVDIEAKYLWEYSADAVSYAIRIIDIPDYGKDTAITARPYYVYEVDGEEIVVYGDAVSKSYNEAAQ